MTFQLTWTLFWLSSAYKREQESEVETKVNHDMIERPIGALDALSPNTKFVVFTSGTRVSFDKSTPIYVGCLKY